MGRPSEEDWDHANAEARPLALDVCRVAVAEWRGATARYAEARRLYEASEAVLPTSPAEEAAEWEMWIRALDCMRLDAQRRLMGCVLVCCRRVERLDDVDEQEHGWEPAALELDGFLYVVAPADRDRGDDRPRLSVVECGSFDSDGFDDPQPTWAALVPGDGDSQPLPEPPVPALRHVVRIARAASKN